MKKLLALMIAGVLVLSACSESDQKEVEKKAEETVEKGKEVAKDTKDKVEEAEEAKEEAKTKIKTDYGKDEEWLVDGLFKLTVHSAKTTKERNEFSEKNPKQVVKITYSYENIGYESEIQDLFITPEHVIDGEGEMAESYPVDYKSAQPTPVGAKMKNAQDAYGLMNKSEEVIINFSIYDSDFKEHKASFKIPVTQGK